MKCAKRINAPSKSVEYNPENLNIGHNYTNIKLFGVPFNIASYALLTHMVAEQAGLDVGEFIWSGGDVHLYSNHFEQAKEQLSREPLALPQLKIKRKPDSLFDYEFEDFEIVGYESHPHIKAPVAV